jgi:3-methyladenine DNA glycosylase AlkC
MNIVGARRKSMPKDNSVKQWFGTNLAELLAQKISYVSPDFNSSGYISEIKKQVEDLSYTQRVEVHAKALQKYLPQNYPHALKILTSILGEENPNETGMFTHYYWILPIGKFVELYGLEYFDDSLQALAQITKRNTVEYAIRAYIRKYPKKTLRIMKTWSKSENFHLRRLASEGLRPKLPWATKLDLFIENPTPVFSILDTLIEDDSKFVQKSVANNIADYVKVNKPAAAAFIAKHGKSENKNTQWILKHATRKVQV